MFSADEVRTIRRLCRASFTGRHLSEAEQRLMECFWQKNAGEYNRITEEVRNEERERLRGGDFG